MTATNDLDRLVASWLETAGPTDIHPEVVTAALTTARRTRRRSTLGTWLAGPAPWPTNGRRVSITALPPAMRVAIVVGLLGLLAAGALVVGSKPPPQRLAGVIEPTGSTREAIFGASTALLPNGSVLVIGATMDGDLHAETYDPAIGVFTPLDSLGRSPWLGYPLGVVRLPDGTVLIVARSFGSVSGITGGGYALRYDPATTEFHRSAGFASTAGLPTELADYSFATWPATTLPDGRVRWADPVLSEESVLYNPATDIFTLGSSSLVVPLPPPYADVDPRGLGSVQLADGRYLFLGEYFGENPPFMILDPRTGHETTLDWPLVHGARYTGTRLPDGRILILGRSGTAIYDPSSDRLAEVDVPATFVPRIWLPDGRLLIEQLDTASPAGEATTGAWVFDPDGDSFTRLGTQATPGVQAAWGLLSDGRILIIDGDPSRAPGSPGSAWILH